VRRALLLLPAVAALGVTLTNCGGSRSVPEDSGADGTADYGPDAAGHALDAATSEGSVAVDAGLACLTAYEAGSSPTGPCPVTPPAEGSACDVPSYSCEYGDSWWMRCDLVMFCGNGAWHAEVDGGQCPSSAGGACPTGACPATWAEALAVDASACPASSCQYPEGDCLCDPGCTATQGWSCVAAAPGCPYPRPRLGTPCHQDADAAVPPCDMGWTQCICEQSLYCAGGLWLGDPFGSPCKQ